MVEYQNPKYSDLEDRTFKFACDCRTSIRKLPKVSQNIEDGDQLIRASGSVAANYIEANESISPKDFVHRIKICRKETKESRLWLRLLHIADNTDLDGERKRLLARQLS